MHSSSRWKKECPTPTIPFCQEQCEEVKVHNVSMFPLLLFYVLSLSPLRLRTCRWKMLSLPFFRLYWYLDKPYSSVVSLSSAASTILAITIVIATLLSTATTTVRACQATRPTTTPISKRCFFYCYLLLLFLLLNFPL